MTRGTPTERDALTERLLAAWDTAVEVGTYETWGNADRVTVSFDGALPDALYPTHIDSRGTYRFVGVNARGPRPTVIVEIQRYPSLTLEADR